MFGGSTFLKESKFLRGQNLWGIKNFGESTFLGVNIFGGSKYLGGKTLWGLNFWRVNIFRASKVLAWS